MPTDRKGNIQIIFTFHYGSILMLLKLNCDINIIEFTFHYGSILIRRTDISYVGYKNMVELSTLFFLLLKILKNMALYDEEHQN